VSCHCVQDEVSELPGRRMGTEGVEGRRAIVFESSKESNRRGAGPPKFTCMTLTGDDHRSGDVLTLAVARRGSRLLRRVALQPAWSSGPKAFFRWIQFKESVTFAYDPVRTHSEIYRRS
jgi:hypothetical protein